MIRRLIVIVCGTALVIVAMAVSLLELSWEGRGDKLQLPTLIAPMSPTEVRVKAVEREAEPLEQDAVAAASGAVSIVCGMDEATADRYESRNNALRSIARRHGANEQRENMV